MSYPSVHIQVRETLEREAFIDALVDSDMQLRMKESRPQNLNESIRLEVDPDEHYEIEEKPLVKY